MGHVTGGWGLGGGGTEWVIWEETWFAFSPLDSDMKWSVPQSLCEWCFGELFKRVMPALKTIHCQFQSLALTFGCLAKVNLNKLENLRSSG